MNSITLRRLVIFGGLGCFLAATALIVYVSVRWSPETEHISGNVATPSSDTEVSADSQNLGTDKVSNSSTQLWLIIVTLVAHAV